MELKTRYKAELNLDDGHYRTELLGDDEYGQPWFELGIYAVNPIPEQRLQELVRRINALIEAHSEVLE